MADLLTVPELEAMDDSAHTSGGVKRLERALATMSERELAAQMVERCLDRAVMHRVTAVQLGRALMWFAQNPDVLSITLWDVPWDRATARSEFRAARTFHRRICGQLGRWRRRYATALAAEAANTNDTASTAAA